jgi:magnesium chelatase subunit I
MPISLLENVLSNAERRAIRLSESEIVPRVSDLYAALPAITGKIELEYEGELIGSATIARELIRRAADATFRARAGGINTDDVVMWFDAGAALQVTDEVDSATIYRAFGTVPGLVSLVHRVGLAREGDAALGAAGCELVLESLVARRRLSRSDSGQYSRSGQEPRRRPGQDSFGSGFSA